MNPKAMKKAAEKAAPDQTPEAPSSDQIRAETQEAVKSLNEAVSKLSPEARETLARLGVTIPSGDLKDAVEGRHKYGLRCTQCNDVALYFVGDKFTDVHNGQVYDEPQPHMLAMHLPWTQSLPSHEINRVRPLCQNCSHPVEMRVGGEFRMDRGRLVEVNAFIASRDASYDRAVLAKARREVGQMNDTFSTADGTQVSVRDRVPNNIRDEKISQVLAKNHPEAWREVQLIDQQYGGQLLQAIADELK